MNDLLDYFENNTGNLIHKWMHYFDIYDRHFSRFRGTDVHVLEIGVFQGGSVRMWRDYFGKDAQIFGADVNPACKDLGGERIEIFIGDQADEGFLRQLAEQIPRIDILIDDGGHRMDQQIKTFEVLYPHVSERGIYLCEDLQTSYSSRHGGGYRRPGTFIEHAKPLIDSLHAWHSDAVSKQPDAAEFARHTDSLHFYDSVLVIEKTPRSEPVHRKTGRPVVSEEAWHRPKSLLRRATEQIKSSFRDRD